MGFFFDDKKSLSQYEWKEEVRSKLYSKDFTSEEIDRIEGLFWTDMNEASEYEAGIDKAEFDAKMQWLSTRDHMKAFYFDERDLENIRAVFEPYLV